MLTALMLAAGISTACPTYIVDRQSIEDAPAGWEFRVEGSKRELRFADVQWGPPPISGPTKSLKPEERSAGEYVWPLDPKSKHWIVCHYQDTAVVLIRVINRAKDCTFTESRYDNRRYRHLPATMVCRPAD